MFLSNDLDYDEQLHHAMSASTSPHSTSLMSHARSLTTSTTPSTHTIRPLRAFLPANLPTNSSSTSAEKAGQLKILLLENVSQEAAKFLQSQGYHVDHYTKAWSESELCERIGEYQAVGIRSKTKITAKVIKAATNVRTHRLPYLPDREESRC